MTANNLSFYTQVFDNLDNDISEKSRIKVLEKYFQKYLPSLSSSYPDVVQKFILGKISYDDMLEIFDIAIPFQRQRQEDKIYRFNKEDARVYGPRSFSPTPLKFLRIPLQLELIRFQEAFGPRKNIDPERVPGTIKVRNNTCRRVASSGAW